jgi:hypothetical protein
MPELEYSYATSSFALAPSILYVFRECPTPDRFSLENRISFFIQVPYLVTTEYWLDTSVLIFACTCLCGN